MSLIWHDSLATGSSDIDTQHKELIQRVNGLLVAEEKGGVGREEISKTIQYLTDYVVYHFGAEERAMEKYGYSNTSAHKAQHALFVKLFLGLKDRLLMEGITPKLQQETNDLLVDWLVNHIKFSDRALGMFMKMKNANL